MLYFQKHPSFWMFGSRSSHSPQVARGGWTILFYNILNRKAYIIIFIPEMFGRDIGPSPMSTSESPLSMTNFFGAD